MKGETAQKRARVGDVVKIRATHEYEWPETERGWVWAHVVSATNEPLINIVAIPEAVFVHVTSGWVSDEDGTSSLCVEDEVMIFKPDKAPNKFWGYLAYRELTGNAQAI